MRKSIGLLALLAALGVIAVSAASASATVVEPAETNVTAKNVGNVVLTPENGTSVEPLLCEESEATIEVPAAPNNSLENGSVTANLAAPPSFNKCKTGAGIPTVVKTNENAGGWTTTAFQNEENEAKEVPAGVTIVVPAGGAEIEIPLAECTITVSEGVSTGIGAGYSNGTLSVKGQVPVKGPAGTACAVGSPAVYEATYEVPGLTITGP
jgi:hypothetical protein